MSEAEASPASPPSLVTVDGPAGSGKTTLGRRLAAALGVPLIDTGLFYRAVTVEARRRRIEADDVAGLTAMLGELRIEINTSPAAGRVRTRACSCRRPRKGGT